VGTELKQDLKAIVEHLSKQDIETQKKFKTEPPIIEDSFTFKLWNEFFNYPEQSNWNRDLSKKELSMMRKKMDEFLNAMDTDAIDFEGGENTDFVIKKSYMGKEDLCFCGSGKKVIECCIPEDEFNRLAQKERERTKGKSK
jgi:hypothetical protein